MTLDQIPKPLDLPKELAALEAQLSHRGRWAPLYVEPMFGSGERFTFAIAVTSADGEATVSRVIRPEVLRVLYGAKAKHFSEMLASTERAVEQALLRGDAEIALPWSGFALGEFREARGRSANDLIDQGRMMCASLSTATVEEQQALEADDDERETRRWAQQIQTAVTTKSKDLGPYFLREWMPAGKSIPSRFGFFNGHYAAHFGVVRKDNPSSSLYHLKARLWELATARDDAFTTISGRDLLLATPNLKSATVTLPMRNRVRDVIDKVTEEADRHEIYVMSTSKVDDASRRIYKQARSLAA